MSDLTCDDNQLEVCEGLVNVAGEMRPIQLPKMIGSIPDGHTLHFIHNYNNVSSQKRYITSSHDKHLFFSVFNDGELHTEVIYDNPIDVVEVKSIGNTLIVNTGNGLHFFLWKSGQYKDIGTNIPKPQFTATTYRSGKTARSSVDTNGMASAGFYGSGTILYCYVDKEEDFENAYMGVFAETKNMAEKEGGFVNPFFVRYALELYDGSLIYISSPILMHTNLDRNATWNFKFNDDAVRMLECKIQPSSLMIRQKTDYSDFSDIVKGVAVYISRPSDLFESIEQRIAIDAPENAGKRFWRTADSPRSFFVANGRIQEEVPEGNKHYAYFMNLKSEKEASRQLVNDSYVYFKLCSIGLKPLNEFTDAKDFFGDDVLSNIETQPKLENDDYFGWTDTIPQHIETYNRRMLMYGIDRSFFDGFAQFNNIDFTYRTEQDKGFNVDTNITIEVHIDAPDGERIVQRKVNTKEMFMGNGEDSYGLWFYYPDPRAREVYVYSNVQRDDGMKSRVIMHAELKEHPGLNGAYYIGKCPYTQLAYEIIDTEKEIISDKSPEVPNNAHERLDNYLMQSEVDNPFAFHAESYNRVGNGDIIGVAALTTALTQDAYKVSTTLCFTTQGIWALINNDAGVFSSIPPAFSREVCSSAQSITMTDNAVFFASQKGLMCITHASESGTVCVSKQLQGIGHSDFVRMLNNANIAYDYKGGQLIIISRRSKDVYISGEEGKLYYGVTKNSIGTYFFRMRTIDPAEHDIVAWVDIKTLDGTETSYQVTLPKGETSCQVAVDSTTEIVRVSQASSRQMIQLPFGDIDKEFAQDTQVYVYDIASSTFATRNHYLPHGVSSIVVGDYPDNIIQSLDGELFSLYEKPNRDEDENMYDCTLVTRPLKLDGSIYIKSLRRLRPLMMMEGQKKIAVVASNNLRDWYELQSIYGKGWRFFKFIITFSGMKALDSYSGMYMETAIRYTDKPH